MKRSIIALAVTALVLYPQVGTASILRQLQKIPVSQIGTKIKTVTSSNNFLLPTTMALHSDSSYEAAANLLTIPLYAYNAGLGVAASSLIGFSFHGLYDVQKAYNNNLLQQKPGLSQIINQTFPVVTPAPGVAYSCSSLGTASTICTNKVIVLGNLVSTAEVGNISSKTPEEYASIWPRFSGNYFEIIRDLHYTDVGWYFYLDKYTYTIEDGTPTPSGAPTSLSVEQAETLVNKIVEAINNNTQINNELNDVLTNHSDVINNYPDNITQNEIQNWYNTNNQTVNNTLINNLEQLAADNPDNIEIKIALEQAKADAEKEENTPQPEYDVPSTWYTKKCDLSKGLSSCINYQQVIDASSAFQSTALYQVPNLLLDCLGYVEGDGCEYPPVLTVDFHNRFSNKPIVVDLSPFESVVKVMKFFFSIICIIGTGKAVMALYN